MPVFEHMSKMRFPPKRLEFPCNDTVVGGGKIFEEGLDVKERFRMLGSTEQSSPTSVLQAPTLDGKAEGAEGAEEGGREGETRGRNHNLQHFTLNPKRMLGWGGELSNV